MPVTGQIKKNEPAKVAPTPTQGIRSLITKYEKEIANALPKVMTAERFTRIVLSAVTANPDLANCTPASFIGAMLNSAQLGLEPNSPLGQAYIIPYNSKNGKIAQFQIGYKGLIALAYRSGCVKSIEAHEVYENDEFFYEFGLEPKLIHRPALLNRGKVIAYYAVWRGNDGTNGYHVMSLDDVKQYATKYSQAYAKGWTSPWKSDFDAMAKKTCIKQALKYAPLSSELQNQIAQDETAKSFKGDDMDIQILPNEIVETEYELTEEGEVINE